MKYPIADRPTPRVEELAGQLPREPTARAMTISEVNRAADASTPMSSLARVDSGIVSVGLNALEFVVET